MKRLRLSFFIVGFALFAQTSVPVTGTGTIPPGTFQAPLSVSPPLTLTGNQLGCTGCTGSGGGGGGAAPYLCAISNVASLTCTHNLNTSTPVIACYDSTGNLMGGTGSAASVQSVVVSSPNAVALTFSSAVSGNCIISTGGIVPVAQVQTLTPPVQANWTAFNVTGMVQSPIYTANRWEWTTNTGTGNNLQGMTTPVPTAPYTKLLRVWMYLCNVPYCNAGVGWSDGAKYTLAEFMTWDPAGLAGGGTNGFPPTFVPANYANLTTSAGAPAFPLGLTSNMIAPSGIPVWFRLADDGTNLTVDYSIDANYWVNLLKEGDTAATGYLTPSQIAVVANTGSSSKNVKVTLDSFQ